MGREGGALAGLDARRVDGELGCDGAPQAVALAVRHGVIHEHVPRHRGEGGLGDEVWHRLDERRKTPRGEGKRGLQKPLELHERLLVEDHGVEVGDPNPRLLQAPPRHLGRKRVVVLAACEPLLLSGRHDATVLEQRRRAVVKERRDAEDVHGAFEMKNPGRPSRPTGASE